jgi:hypothetical protein
LVFRRASRDPLCLVGVGSYLSAPSAPRGSPELQSPCKLSRKPIAYFLPFRPRFSPDPRVFNSSPVRLCRLSPHAASLVLRRHLERFAQAKLASFISRPADSSSARRPKPLASLACPSAFPNLRARSSLHSLKSRGESGGATSARPALRVWLPSRRCQLRRPSEASSSSPHSGAFPLQSFSPPGDPQEVSLSGSAPTLPCKTSWPCTGAPAAFPHLGSRLAASG